MDSPAAAAPTAFVVPGAGIVVVAPASGKTASSSLNIAGLFKRVAPAPKKPSRESAASAEKYDII